MRLAAVIALLCAAGPAWAQSERLDHRGALGLAVGAGIEHASIQLFSAASTDARTGDANRLVLELDPTFAVGTEGNELVGTLRFLKGPDTGVALGFGYRAYFGRDAWKTYFQGGFKLDSAPNLALGLQAGFGVMYELTALWGIYLQPGASFEVGKTLRVGAELTGGVQLRTYVLE